MCLSFLTRGTASAASCSLYQQLSGFCFALQDKLEVRFICSYSGMIHDRRTFNAMNAIHRIILKPSARGVDSSLKRMCVNFILDTTTTGVSPGGIWFSNILHSWENILLRTTYDTLQVSSELSVDYIRRGLHSMAH
ncbi:uncharacterized protein [Apostichopus japonicus]|uniref:uncharacterized protein isoform X2 n=1 Tax=Stichopus japonicus TaxID=307972 RepID=UPI003AB6A8A1